MVGHGVFERVILFVVYMSTCVFVVVGSAGAQGMDQPDLQAEEDFLKGVSAYESGDYQGAVISFQRSFRFQRRPNLAFNIAMSFERLKDLSSAAEWYRQYRTLKSVDELGIDQRLKKLDGALAALSPTALTRAHTTGTMNNYKGTAFGLGVAGILTASVLGSMAMYYSARSSETSNLKRQGVYARNAETFAITTDVTFVLSMASLLYGGTRLFESAAVSK